MCSCTIDMCSYKTGQKLVLCQVLIHDCCGFTRRIKQMFDGCKVMLYQDCIWLLTFCRRRSWSCITLAISEIYITFVRKRRPLHTFMTALHSYVWVCYDFRDMWRLMLAEQLNYGNSAFVSVNYSCTWIGIGTCTLTQNLLHKISTWLYR